MKENESTEHGIVIVTGASRGIGRASVRAFARRKNPVLAVARTKSCLQTLHDETGCYILAGDIRNEDFADAIFTKAEQIMISLGTREKPAPLTALVNNAGIAHIGLLQDMKLSEWNDVISTNLTAAFLTCRRAIPIFLHQGKGSIVNVSSVWGNVGASCETAYSASKGGINAFTKALAKELAPSNIRVNAAAFGVIDTEMNGFLSAEERAELEDEIGMGRFGRPEEAAELIVDLALNHPYLTGQIITMDGAWQ